MRSRSTNVYSPIITSPAPNLNEKFPNIPNSLLDEVIILFISQETNETVHRYLINEGVSTDDATSLIAYLTVPPEHYLE